VTTRVSAITWRVRFVT